MQSPTVSTQLPEESYSQEGGGNELAAVGLSMPMGEEDHSVFYDRGELYKAQEEGSEAGEIIDENAVLPESAPAAETESAEAEPLEAKAEEAPVEDSPYLDPAYMDKLAKVKVNGQESEVQIGEALKNYQKYQAADQLFQENSKKERFVTTLSTKLSTDLVNVLDMLELSGAEVEPQVQRWINARQTIEQGPPELKEMYNLLKSKQTDDFRAQIHAENRAREHEDSQRAVAQNEIVSSVKNFFEQDGKPCDEQTATLAYVIKNHADQNGIPMSHQEAAQKTEQWIISNGLQMAAKSKGSILKLIPSSLLRRIQAENAEAVRTSQAKANVTPIASGKPGQKRYVIQKL